jgi:hypothetical protein
VINGAILNDFLTCSKTTISKHFKSELNYIGKTVSLENYEN